MPTPSYHPLRRLWDRVSHLGPEATRFGIVGLTGVALQFVVFNVLRYAGPGAEGVLVDKPITAQVIAIGAATVITYLGNRYWTYHHREKGHPARELPVFVLLNAIAIGIGALCLAISHYLLGLTSPLADNISGNVIGLGLGTLFRFWSYRRFVFTGGARGVQPAEDPAARVQED
jgi:putative flippase GtrA